MISTQELAGKLKGKLHAPDWAEFVKTSHAKQRMPADQDWWYVRAASILNKVKDKGPIGASKLRTTYGSSKNRGVKPNKFYRASGNHIRKMLQQLEAAGYVKQKEVNGHKGRIITKAGLELYGNSKTSKQENKANKAEQKN